MAHRNYTAFPKKTGQTRKIKHENSKNVLNSYSIKFRSCCALYRCKSAFSCLDDHQQQRQQPNIARKSHVRDESYRKIRNVCYIRTGNSYPYKLINYLLKIDYVQVNRLCMWTHIKTVRIGIRIIRALGRVKWNTTVEKYTKCVHSWRICGALHRNRAHIAKDAIKSYTYQFFFRKWQTYKRNLIINFIRARTLFPFRRASFAIFMFRISMPVKCTRARRRKKNPS